MNIPYHPMLVHFPIVLTVLMPLLLVAFYFVQKKLWASDKIWFLALGLSVLTPITTFLAIQAGENDEKLVEKIVREHLIKSHSEWGEWVLWIGIAVFVLILAAMLFKKIKILKIFPLLMSLAAIFPLLQVGKSGGELVYKYNAAAVYVQNAGSSNPTAPIENEDDD